MMAETHEDKERSAREGEAQVEMILSPKPGGQRGDKKKTCAWLTWNADSAKSLTPEQKQILRANLGVESGKAAILSFKCYEHAEGLANRRAAYERLEQEIKVLLVVPEERKETKVPERVKGRNEASDYRTKMAKTARGKVDSD